MVTLVGNAATAVEHRLTAAGVTVARFRLAATSRRWDKAQERWTDGETSFYTVRSWRGLADNVAASVTVGEPLIVQGRLRLREGEQPPEKGGQRWFSAEVDAVAIGHDLTRGTAAFRRVLRALRTGADGPPSPAQQSSPAPEPSPAPQSAPAARSSRPPEPHAAQQSSRAPEPSPASQSTPAPQSAPAPDTSAPPQRHPSQSSPSPSSPSSPQPPPPSRPSSPSQQDLWEGALPEGRTGTTANAPTEADTSEAAVKAETATTAPPASRGKPAAKAPPAARARRGARGPAVLKRQTPAKASTVAKTPTTSGIAAVAEPPRGSAGPSSAVTHSPEKVAVP
ncbi:single-stranded DNA-binding protein [Streptomyces sp. Isolate_219]|uniref:single-stranded DNA-binding protein n=1 Tax=Streptomyces sp. Isolate_219 TaxID=2950110 RepID=UPI002905E856|nr:single-stranded DNA-binding protein [Streptomyces sp. Isolate_219]